MAKRGAVKKLPENLALDSEQQQDFHSKVKKLKKNSDVPGVIYIGHIPHGFMESQMKDYFSQFGTVSKLRIARSKKTGRPKGYAFVQFRSEAVAKIVADCMNNYLMFHRLLKCQLMPLSKVHPETFKGSGRKFKQPKAHAIAKDRHNSTKSEKQQVLALKKMKAKKVKGMAKLAAMGIEYDYPNLFTKEDVQKALDKQTTKPEDSDTPVDMDKLAEEASQMLYGYGNSDDENNDIANDSEESVEEVTVPSPKPKRRKITKIKATDKTEKKETPGKKTSKPKRKAETKKSKLKTTKKGKK